MCSKSDGTAAISPGPGLLAELDVAKVLKAGGCESETVTSGLLVTLILVLGDFSRGAVRSFNFLLIILGLKGVCFLRRLCKNLGNRLI